MDTHGLHQRQPHSALRKKRFHPARLPGLHSVGLQNDASSGASRVVDRQPLQERQLFSIPGVTLPLTDLFPPSLPTDAETSPDATPTAASTTSTTETTSSTTETSTTTSTTSTTSESTTSTTSTSTTPTPTPTPPPTTPPSISQVVVTEVDNETAVLTRVLSKTTSSSATSTPTTLNSKNEDDGSNTGPIIGGVVAGLIALAVLVISLVWFFRRRQREKLENDVTPFNPHDFRRSAYLINDEPKDGAGSGASLSRGPTFNYGAANDSLPGHPGLASTPRPPSMIERKLAHTPVNGYDNGFAAYSTSSHGHGEAPPMNAPPMPSHYYDGGAGDQYGYGAGAAPYGYNQYGMYGGNPHYSGPPFGAYTAPGQVVDPQNMPYGPGQMVDPNAQNPFMTPAQSYAPQLQSPFSPAPSVERAPEAVIAEVGGAAVLTRSISNKSKHSGKSGLSISIPKGAPVNATVVNGSAATIEEGNGTAVEYPTMKRQASSSSIATARSGSVKRTPVPALPIGEEEVPSNDYVDLSRSSVSPYQALQYAEISKRLNTEIPKGLRSTTDDDLPPVPTPTQDAHGPSPFADPQTTSESDTDETEHMPPTLPSRSPRIESLPPQLPEISIAATDSARSSNSFLNPPAGMSLMMSMGLNSAKDSPIYPSGITAGASPLLGKFPVTPSPLGGSFGIETPKAEQGTSGFSKLREEVKVEQVQQPEVKHAKGEEKQRPMTVYDEADAYGGI